ncbi:hypothetical protein J6590_023620 [Homalodisca vitripennis]|nr:hypothetical protein J6590_023620 [Homalodisca vitripennis]
MFSRFYSPLSTHESTNEDLGAKSARLAGRVLRCSGRLLIKGGPRQPALSPARNKLGAWCTRPAVLGNTVAFTVRERVFYTTYYTVLPLRPPHIRTFLNRFSSLPLEKNEERPTTGRKRVSLVFRERNACPVIDDSPTSLLGKLSLQIAPLGNSAMIPVRPFPLHYTNKCLTCHDLHSPGDTPATQLVVREYGYISDVHFMKRVSTHVLPHTAIFLHLVFQFDCDLGQGIIEILAFSVSWCDSDFVRSVPWIAADSSNSGDGNTVPILSKRECRITPLASRDNIVFQLLKTLSESRASALTFPVWRGFRATDVADLVGQPDTIPAETTQGCFGSMATDGLFFLFIMVHNTRRTTRVLPSSGHPFPKRIADTTRSLIVTVRLEVIFTNKTGALCPFGEDGHENRNTLHCGQYLFWGLGTHAAHGPRGKDNMRDDSTTHDAFRIWSKNKCSRTSYSHVTRGAQGTKKPDYGKALEVVATGPTVASYGHDCV